MSNKFDAGHPAKVITIITVMIIVIMTIIIITINIQ